MSDDYETERGYAEVLEEVRGHASKRLTAWVLLAARKKARRQRRVLAEMNEKVAKLEAEHAEMVQLLHEYTGGFEGMPDEKVQAISDGHSADRVYAKREIRRRALLAEIDGGSSNG